MACVVGESANTSLHHPVDSFKVVSSRYTNLISKEVAFSERIFAGFHARQFLLWRGLINICCALGWEYCLLPQLLSKDSEKYGGKHAGLVFLSYSRADGLPHPTGCCTGELTSAQTGMWAAVMPGWLWCAGMWLVICCEGAPVFGRGVNRWHLGSTLHLLVNK